MKRSRGCGKNARHPRKHAEYSPYRAMLTRCYNPNVLQYKDYGGRGIEVCERWLGSAASRTSSRTWGLDRQQSTASNAGTMLKATAPKTVVGRP